jgi:hypothetical protein
MIIYRQPEEKRTLAQPQQMLILSALPTLGTVAAKVRNEPNWTDAAMITNGGFRDSL